MFQKGCAFLFLVFCCVMSGSPAFTEQGDGLKTFDVDETVVTATKSEKPVADVSQDVNIITSEQIEQTNAQTIGDILKYVPGLNLNQSDDIPGASTWKATLRGLSIDSGYVLFLIDGQRVKGRGMGEYGNGLNQIPVEMIERIEVVKGPSSVLYGSDAVAGVVNIITKPIAKKETTNIFTNIGSRKIARQGFNYGNNIGKVGFRTSAAIERANLDSYESRYINNRLSYSLENSSVRLDANVNDIYSGSNVERRVSFAPELTHNFEDASKLNLKAYWYNWDFTHSSRYGNLYWSQAEAQYSRIVAGRHSIISGVEFLRQGMDYNYKGIKQDNVQLWPHLEKNVDNFSFYAQDELAVHEKVILTLGARLDNQSEYGGVVSPRFSGLYDITKTTRMRASVGRSFKSPTIRQIYYPGLFMHSSTNYTLANPGLKPEYSTGYTMSFEHTIGKTFWASLMIYRNDLTDMVEDYDTGNKEAGIMITSYRNIAKARTQGAEGEFRFQMIKGFSGVFTAAYTDATNKDTNKKLTTVPEWTEGLQLSYLNSKFGFGIDWGLIHYGEVYTDEANTIKTDGYYMAEAKIIKNVTTNAKISFECDNIFDSDYGVESTTRVPRTYQVKLNFTH